MRVSIVGSWRPEHSDWTFRGSFDDFSQACKLIGRELAKENQEIIVGGDGVDTADAHIVSGMLEVCSGAERERPLIYVVHTLRSDHSFEDLAKRYPGIFSFCPSRETRWAEAHFVAIRECDAIIMIAGGRGTYQTGLVAIASRKKIAPIASFGGASSKILDIIEDLGKHNQHNLRYLRNPWSEFIVKRAFKLLGIGRKPRILIIHGRADEWREVRDWLESQIDGDNIEVMVQELGKGDTLPEKFERLAGLVDAAVAVVTPDDRGGLSTDDLTAYGFRARQNVWLEIGWFWGRLGRDKIFIAQKGNVETPSDLEGMEFYKYQNDASEMYDKLKIFCRHIQMKCK